MTYKFNRISHSLLKQKDRSIAQSTRPQRSVSLSFEAPNEQQQQQQIVIARETQNATKIQWAVSWEVTDCYCLLTFVL
jgi:hypothetical protein